MDTIVAAIPNDDSAGKNGRTKATDNGVWAEGGAFREGFKAGWKAGHAAGVQDGYWKGWMASSSRR